MSKLNEYGCSSRAKIIDTLLQDVFPDSRKICVLPQYFVARLDRVCVGLCFQAAVSQLVADRQLCFAAEFPGLTVSRRGLAIILILLGDVA